MKYVNVIFLCLVTINDNVLGTLSKSDRAKTKSSRLKIKEGPQSTSVFDRDLVVSEPNGKDIIQEHATYFFKTSFRNFNGPVLAYVTPWNSHGYDVAKNFTSKFTHISPVWLQIKRLGSQKYQIAGVHDIDKSWLAQLRKNNPRIKIDVRVFFDGWSIQDFTALFSQRLEQEALVKTVLSACLTHNFDGIVLELWSQVGGSVRSEILIDFIRLVAKTLQTKNLELILVIPPKRGAGPEIFRSEDFDELYDSVAGFSLMTYDYSSIQRPGPNSPINWVRQSVTSLVPDAGERRSKILLGLNFYGNSYTSSGGGPVIGRDAVKLLKDYKGKLKYDDVSVENFFEVRSTSEKHLVFYPTLFSIHKRIQLAEELGTGLSIWEIGQGLDYFYDLL